MFGKLTKEEEQCIDDILTSGLNEINEVPSLALSTMSNRSTPCYGQSSNLNLSRNHKNNSLSKNSSNNQLTGENNNKSNSSVSFHLSSSFNEKENINTNKIENANKDKNNDLKNILNNNNNIRFSEENILNIINSTEGTSTKKAEIELSNSTQKLIDKYINIDLNSNQKDLKNSYRNAIEMADNALLSPSFVNLNNNISNIDNSQKTNTNNEDEIIYY